MAAANTVIPTIADHPATAVAIENPTGARRQRMKRSFLGIAAFAATLAVSLSAEGPALAAPVSPLGAAFTQASFAPYLFGGRQYCWYDSAWRGPGFYWCGYAWRDGIGWGGPRGWHGWRGGGGRIGGHAGVGRPGGHFGAGGVNHFGGGVGHTGGANHVGGFGHASGASFGGGGHFGGGMGHTGGFGGGGHFGGGGMGHAGGGGGGHGGGGGGHR